MSIFPSILYQLHDYIITYKEYISEIWQNLYKIYCSYPGVGKSGEEEEEEEKIGSNTFK